MFDSLNKIIQFSLLTILSLFLLTGCVTTGHPSYSYDLEVDRMFSPPPTLLENHTYYYRGSAVEPDAIIAVDNNFLLTGKVWSKVEISRKILNDWAFWFDTYSGWWSCPYRGVRLFSPDGGQVGVGYSKWTFSVVKMAGQNEIVVYPPRALMSCRRQEEMNDR